MSGKSRIPDETKREAKRLFRFVMAKLNDKASPERDQQIVDGIAEFLWQHHRIGANSSVSYAKNILESYGKDRAVMHFKQFLEAAKSDVALGARNVPMMKEESLL